MTSTRFRDYMLRAMSCERMAGVVMDDAIQTIYLDLAAQWRDLAQQIEMWNMYQDKPASRNSH
jgi:hypothetical protein